MALDLSRRRFVLSGIAGAVAATAGCTSLQGDGDGEDGRRLSLSLVRWDGSLRDRFVADLSETQPPWDEEAFAAVLDGERFTTQYRKPFFSTPADPEYARRDGTYYRLGSVIVDEAAETHPVLKLYEVDDGTDPEPVARDALPEGDQRAVKIAHMAARARDDEGGVPWGLVERGGYVYRDDAAIENSDLLADDGTDRVSYRDITYRVETTRERFHERVYRATAEPVAEDPEGMERALRAKFVRARLSRDALSADARDVLQAAERDGHAERHPYSEALQSVLRAIEERAYLDGNVKKDALPERHPRDVVVYDGDYFDYRLTLGGEGD